MKFTTAEIRALVSATMPVPMRDAAEEAFIDWLNQIVENTFRQGVRAVEESDVAYQQGFRDGYDEAEAERGY